MSGPAIPARRVWRMMTRLAGLLTLLLALPPGEPPAVRVEVARPEAPAVAIQLLGRQGHVAAVLSLRAPAHSVAGGEGLAVNDQSGAVTVPIRPGRYVLSQTWELTATYAQALLGKAAAAEFAPEPVLDPLWVSRREPFHGAAKKDFGLQVTIRVAGD